MQTAITTMNISGNIHDASRAINRLGVSDYLLSLECNTGMNTIAVFRMPVELARDFREGSRSWAGDHQDIEQGLAAALAPSANTVNAEALEMLSDCVELLRRIEQNTSHCLSRFDLGALDATVETCQTFLEEARQ